jgi:hypothetical protein
VNRQHLATFLWLRWRLRVNQFKRGGIANSIIMVILAVIGLFVAVGLLIASFFVGLFALSDVSPPVLMYVWDGIVVAFLFLWAIGLLTELQRSESLSLQKFLHLPVSLSGAFLINYLSSLFSVHMIVFVPAMLGLSLGLIFSRGPAMLLLLLLVAGFLLMVTALTYQFQGWLAALMVNQRRRRTIIVFVTAGLILVCQLPNLLNVIQPWKSLEEDDTLTRLTAKEAALKVSLSGGKVSADDFKKQQEEIQSEQRARKEELKEHLSQQAEQMAGIINLCVPPGWLPLGALEAARGSFLFSGLAILGMMLIGTASLWRAYRTTLRLYTGDFGSRKTKAVAATPLPAKTRPSSVTLLERRLPWLSEHASAIAVASLRALIRAPEAKMLLLTPVILVLVFGSLLVARRMVVPDVVRPLVALGAAGMIMLTMIQLMGNQFGFDRSGFRVFVLCSADRKDILLGKNLAFGALALVMGLAAVVVAQIVYPVRLDYFLATLPQLVSMYLLFCVFANLLSILAPMPIAAGSLKPRNPKLIPILFQMAFLFLLPLIFGPVLLPLGVELIAGAFGWMPGVPICLILSAVECVAVVYLYRFILFWQGKLLQARERQILEVVASRAE